MIPLHKFTTIVGVVMIVDDDIGILLAIANYLNFTGYLCFGAQSPDEALAKLHYLQKAGIPDLIITDINMPSNGGRLIDALGADPDLRHIPILPISADRKEIKGLKVLSKPFDLNELKQEITKLIKEKKAG